MGCQCSAVTLTSSVCLPYLFVRGAQWLSKGLIQFSMKRFALFEFLGFEDATVQIGVVKTDESGPVEPHFEFTASFYVSSESSLLFSVTAGISAGVWRIKGSASGDITREDVLGISDEDSSSAQAAPLDTFFSEMLRWLVPDFVISNPNLEIVWKRRPLEYAVKISGGVR